MAKAEVTIVTKDELEALKEELEEKLESMDEIGCDSGVDVTSEEVLMINNPLKKVAYELEGAYNHLQNSIFAVEQLLADMDEDGKEEIIIFER